MMDIEGNYEESHPHELLEILKKEKNEDSVDVGSEEADKLLKEKKIMNNSG